MARKIPIIVGLIVVAALVLFNTTYTVNFHELAIVTRFGKPTGVQRTPGLHLKAPFFIDQAERLDTRLQFIDSPYETVLTRDGQQVAVQAYLLWRLNCDGDAPLKFFGSYGTIEAANEDMQTQLRAAMRLVGSFTFAELLGSGSKLGAAESAILADLKDGRTDGVEPVAVGISQVILPPKTTVAVLRRMAAVQETLANLEESKGNSEADALKSQAASAADTIRSFAEQWGTSIEAVGNEQATVYYEQMKAEADLAIFLAWLDTLRASLSGNTTYVTDTSKAPFHLIDLNAPQDESGIPHPALPQP